MTVLRFDDNRGGLAYPFLPNELQWQIVSHTFGDEEALTMAERGISTINEMLSLMRTREILRQLEARRRIANDNT